MESPFPYQVATFHATDNFVRLPADAWLAGLPTPAVLELRVAGDEEGVIFGRPWYVALGALPASKPATLQVPAALAQALGLPSVLFVSVRALAPLPRALRVTVQPEDADDWEATELGAGDVEARLLQQAVLAQTGSLIPFHPPGGGPPIRLRVLGGVPDAAMLLMHHSTELHVAPVVRGARRASEEDADEAEEEEEDEEGWEEEAEGASEEHAWSVDVRAFALPPASLAAAPPPALAAFMQPRAAAAHPGLRVLESSYAALAQAELLQAAGCPDGGVARITLLSGGITHDPEDAGGPPPPAPRPRGLLVRLGPMRPGLLPAAGTQPPLLLLPRLSREALGAPPLARLRLTREAGLDMADLPAPRRVSLHPLAKAGAEAAGAPPGGALAAALASRGVSLAAAAAAALEPPHRAALSAAGWDGQLAPPSEEEARAAGGAVDAATAARRLFAAWAESQAPAPEGVPVTDGTLLVFESRAPKSPFAAFAFLGGGEEEEEEAEGGGGPLLRATFVLRCEPAEALLPPGPALRAALALLPVSLGPPLPRPYPVEGSEGLLWPLADAHLPSKPPPATGAPLLAASAAAAAAAAHAALPWAPKAVDEALARVRALLCARQRAFLQASRLPAPGGVLLHGPPGVGRSALALAIAAALASDPECAAFAPAVACAELAGEEPDTQHAAMEGLLATARGRRPSLVVLDDLDALCPAPDGDGAGGAGAQPGTPAALCLPLVEWLADAMDALQPGGRGGAQPVAFLATAASPGALAPQLRASGRLDLVIEVPPPDEGGREGLLLGAAQRGGRLAAVGGVAAGGAAEAARATEGYDSADLSVLAERAVLAAAGRLLEPPLEARGHGAAPPAQPLHNPDFKAGRAGLLPSALRGAAISAPEGEPSADGGWAGVGGLLPVRAALEEALQLPARFPSLFAAAPLRLRTGALLYGPPGCGKTLVARAAAAAAGLRLVGVKGPELLNKYIGQSEAGVRALFRKAAACAPCVLFFDEFDAIAPRRGHDNTGVTDRVVNQLLTELDGIEALNGVAVIAATSRPDLLDPALLRPGRLDRMLHCGLPDEPERRAILAAIAPSILPPAAAPPSGFQAALDAAAAQTHGCSGADLAALLSEAQLLAAKEAIEAAEAAGGETEAAAVSVGAQHVRQALSAARPSVSAAELSRLDAIYATFLAGRAGGLGAEPGKGGKPGKRATLA